MLFCHDRCGQRYDDNISHARRFHRITGMSFRLSIAFWWWLAGPFEQRYPDFEVSLSEHDQSDSAAAVSPKWSGRVPLHSSRLIVAGPAPFTLPGSGASRPAASAQNEIVVMSDGDIRLFSMPRNDGLAVSRPEVGLVTCPWIVAHEPGEWRL